MKRVVFDLDETLCVHRNRDYPNAAPVTDAIERIRELKRDFPDCEVVIHTARGMKSCGGDAAKADAKNRAVTEEWLKRNGVPYDQLVFGKPFADAYVDDKAVSLEEWIEKGATRLVGYSGKPNARIGRIVVKSDEDGAQRDWYAMARPLNLKTLSLPHVISWSFGRLFIRYVEGRCFSSITDGELLYYVPLFAAAIREFGSFGVSGENDVAEYARLVRERGELAKMEARRISNLERDLAELAPMFVRRTFCHGDFTLANIVRSEDGQLFVIDPSFKQSFATYLLDAAKFRASLNGLNDVLTCSHRTFLESLAYFDKLWTADELKAIRVLERTHFVRVAGVAAKMGLTGDAERLVLMEAREADR